jgi:hypothetical protein
MSEEKIKYFTAILDTNFLSALEMAIVCVGFKIWILKRKKALTYQDIRNLYDFESCEAYLKAELTRLRKLV